MLKANCPYCNHTVVFLVQPILNEWGICGNCSEVIIATDTGLRKMTLSYFDALSLEKKEIMVEAIKLIKTYKQLRGINQ